MGRAAHQADPGNYVSIIDRKEERTGGYRNETYAQAAKTFCKNGLPPAPGCFTDMTVRVWGPIICLT